MHHESRKGPQKYELKRRLKNVGVAGRTDQIGLVEGSNETEERAEYRCLGSRFYQRT